MNSCKPFKKLSIIVPVYNQEVLLIEALDSIPARDDIQVIVIDDGSTDDTWANLVSYRQRRTELDIVLLYNASNEGVSSAVNKGLDAATGEYIVLLGSDDYFYSDKLEELLSELDGTDIVYFDLETNEGEIFKLTEETKLIFCGSTKFIRKEFIGDIRNNESTKAGEDAEFFVALLKNNPTEKFTGKVIKHYNFPRKGSLSDLWSRGEL